MQRPPIVTPSVLKADDYRIDYGEVGKKWTPVGTQSANIFRALLSSGDGVVVGGTQTGNSIVISNDDGLVWKGEGVIDSVNDVVFSLAHSGNGVWNAGLGQGLANILHSEDNGQTWQKIVGPSAGSSRLLSMGAGRGGRVLGGCFNDGHMIISRNYGRTWADLGVIIPGENRIYCVKYVDNGLWLCGTQPNAKIGISLDDGETWASLGPPPVITWGASIINCMEILPNGIVVVGTTGGAALHYLRGVINPVGTVTWTDSGAPVAAVVGEVFAFSLTHCGNNILIGGTGTTEGHITRSGDGGKSFVDLGRLGSGLEVEVDSISYARKGIVVAGTNRGSIYRSDAPAQLY